jgi:hypothetical protein
MKDPITRHARCGPIPEIGSAAGTEKLGELGRAAI